MTDASNNGIYHDMTDAHVPTEIEPVDNSEPAPGESFYEAMEVCQSECQSG